MRARRQPIWRASTYETCVLLGLDDTDTLDGGCTTYTALQVAAAIRDARGPLSEWDLIGRPRLVRLNPAAPYKTRGNGAMVLPVGPAGAPIETIGRAHGQPLARHEPLLPSSTESPSSTDSTGAPRTTGPRGPAGPAGTANETSPAQPVTEDAVVALRTLISRLLPTAASTADQDPQPGAVLTPDAPNAALYRAAVARLVPGHDASLDLPGRAMRLTPTGRRGEIGALAACAWPAERVTFEAIAYRGEHEQGTMRTLPDDFATWVANIPDTFDNLDTETGRVRCVPRTPCPVQWGIRGMQPRALYAAQNEATASDHWVVATNHGSNDHIRFAATTPQASSVVAVEATVLTTPQRGRGGHLVVAAALPSGAHISLAFYEPTKQLRNQAEQLIAGDALTVVGRCQNEMDTIGVEALRIDATAPRWTPAPNPRCAACARSMKSRGTGAPFRCPSCGIEAPRSARSQTASAGPETGIWHQVPDHVRGHLLAPASWNRLERDVPLIRRPQAAVTTPRAS